MIMVVVVVVIIGSILVSVTDWLCYGYRCLDHPFRSHPGPQNPLRHHPRRLARSFMDPYQHQLHVRLFPHVPLGAGHPIRVQCRCLR